MHLGFDCSTQSLSAIIIDAARGTIEHESSVIFETDLPHYKTTHGFTRGENPDEFFSDPLMWLEALDLLFKKLEEQNAPLSKISAISGSAQQHATVYLNDQFPRSLSSLNQNLSLATQFQGIFTRPVSPIWLDASTQNECQQITEAVGGKETAIHTTGSAITPRFSAAQIRKYALQFPDRWNETDSVHLVSSFLASVLAGQPAPIDYGDGAGMNLLNLSHLEWDEKFTRATAPDILEKLPPLAPTNTIIGEISPYFTRKYDLNPRAKCIVWSGDNPCSLVGMGIIRPGTWIISLGTSYTHFVPLKNPTTDPDGYGHVFGNPIGDFMGLSCFKNGALACVALKEKLGLSWQEFDSQLLTPPTENSTPSLPFFENEITPTAPSADQSETTPRSLIDGQVLNMFHHSHWLGDRPETILVTGGVSKSNGVCQTIANIFQCPVQRLKTTSSASLGAALIAARATGNDIDELIEKFCEPDQQDTIEPDPETEILYQTLAKKFLTALNNHLQNQT